MTLRCGACQSVINLEFASLDHHSSACPACGADSVFVSWKDVLVQILPGEAPVEIGRTLRWAQQELDELEFVALLAAMAELLDNIQAARP